MVSGNCETILLQGKNVSFDRFANILYRVFLRLALAYAPGQTRAFRHPIAQFSRITDYLTQE
jgi:hypothetical protein